MSQNTKPTNHPIVAGDKDICVEKNEECFINITQYDHVMTQNEKEKKDPVSKDEIQFITAERRERKKHFVCVHVTHLGFALGLGGKPSSFLRWRRVRSGKNVNLNPSTHKDEKMPPIR